MTTSPEKDKQKSFFLGGIFKKSDGQKNKKGGAGGSTHAEEDQWIAGAGVDMPGILKQTMKAHSYSS